jgi:O-antigen/teichoic acid export membrane protein
VGAILFAIGYVLLQFDFLYKGHADVVRSYSPLILLSIPILLVEHLSFRFLVARAKIWHRVLIGLLQSLLPLVLFVALWLTLPDSLDAAAWSWFVSIIIVAVYPFWVMRTEGAYPPVFDLKFLGESTRYGISGWMAQCFQLALLRSDFLFISSMRGMEELGYYAIATRMAELLLTLPSSLILPFIPILFGMDKKDTERFTPIVTKVVLLSMIVSCSIVACLGKPILGVVFGRDFLPAYPAFVLLLPGIVAFGVFPFVRFDLFARKLPGLVSLFTGGGLVINAVMNWFLVPKWGIAAAALSSSVGYTISTVALIILYCRVSGHSLRSVLVLNKEDVRTIYSGVMRKMRKSK